MFCRTGTTSLAHKYQTRVEVADSSIPIPYNLSNCKILAERKILFTNEKNETKFNLVDFLATFQSLSKFPKFRLHNMKAMAKDKKVNIEVTF